MRKITALNDLIVIGLLLVAALAAALIPKLFPGGEKHAVVTLDGAVVLDEPLETIEGTKIYTFNSVEIELSSEGARVVSSVCRDGVCVNSGMLTQNGDTAACVPQKVVLRIVGSDKDPVDAVVY